MVEKKVLEIIEDRIKQSKMMRTKISKNIEEAEDKEDLAFWKLERYKNQGGFIELIMLEKEIKEAKE